MVMEEIPNRVYALFNNSFILFDAKTVKQQLVYYARHAIILLF